MVSIQLRGGPFDGQTIERTEVSEVITVQYHEDGCVYGIRYRLWEIGDRFVTTDDRRSAIYNVVDGDWPIVDWDRSMGDPGDVQTVRMVGGPIDGQTRETRFGVCSIVVRDDGAESGLVLATYWRVDNTNVFALERLIDVQ